MTVPRAREQADPPSPPDRLPPRRGGRPSSQTVSAAGRPAGLLRLAGARRGLVGSARALAAAALLALCGALALPATAEAQTATTLVSNVNQVHADDGVENNWMTELSQAFTTGMNEDGYAVTGVDIVSASSTGFTAKVCETDTSYVGRPTSTCTNLDPPDSFAIGTMSFTTMAGTTLPLVKSTTYAVVVEAAEDHPDHGTVQGWNNTYSDGEDMGHDDEWSIRNGFRDRWGPADSQWEDQRDEALRIAINGYAVGSGPTLSVADAEGNEGDGVAFTVTLSEAVTDAVMATWTASIESGDTAVAADLGSPTTGTLTIEISETATTITVPTAEDFTDEENETFTVTLSGVSASAQLAADPTATGTIVDDDEPPIVVTPSADALVSNVGQDQSTTLDGGSVAHERQVAQAFTTGTNEDGYTLAGVDIVSASSTDFTAKVCGTDSGGLPTSTCTDLTPPDSFAVGAMSFTPPADDTLTLTKDTTYAVVLTTPQHGDYLSQGWSATDATGEDTVSAAEWSIADGHLLRTSQSEVATWSSTRGVQPLRIAIRGTTVGGTTPSTPDAPTEFTATLGNMEVALAWDAPASGSGVTGHEYRYKTTGNYLENWTAIADSAVAGMNEASFTVTELTNGTQYTFQLRAVSAAGNGDEAEADPVTPMLGICDRTAKIQEVILGEISGVDNCAAVTDANLASITQLGQLGFGTFNQGITSLQKGDFAGLTSLTILRLGQNGLTALPEGIFAGLAELDELNLFDNQLESLPEGVFDGLVKLEGIVLSSNSLTGVPAGAFDGLPVLVEIDLGGNDLSSLPEDLFSGLTALTTIFLGSNDLESLPDGVFSGLTALENLQLNDNDLTMLPVTVFSGLPALDKLYLHDNDLVCQANWQKAGGASPPERRSNQTTFLRKPCVGSREGAGEASAAVRMGRAMEHRKSDGPGCRGFQIGRRQHRRHRYGEMSAGPAVSENPCTFARLLPGPWEVFKLPRMSHGAV